MKIIINKDEFLEKLNLSSKFTSSKLSSSTSLQGIFLKKEEDKLHFYSTNLNFYYHGFLKSEEKGEFKTVVEPKKISEFLSLLSSGKVEIEIKDKSIVFLQGKTKGEFAVFSPDDFPFLLNLSPKKQKIETKIFKDILPLLFFSASNDESRPVLTGVNFVSRDDETQLVTTDGFRLSLYSFKESLPISSMIIPSLFLSEVSRLIRDEKEVFFSFNGEEKILTFYLKDGEISTRLIEGEYPPYEKVIPIDKKTIIAVEKDEFLRNIKLVSVFARDFSNIVIIEVDENNLKLSPKTGGKEDNVAYQEAEIKGEKQKIAFNYKFLLDFLTNSTSKKIIIELLKPDSPAVFKNEKNDNFLHIIMPIRMQE